MRLRPFSARPVTAVVIGAVLATLVATAVPAVAAHRHRTMSWAAAATATIHPGVQTFTNGAQCTANFVFTNGRSVFIGQAAHCSSTDGSTATNGCEAHSLPLGTPVTVTGASKPGRLVYNSWLTMRNVTQERNPNICQYNDFALVRLAAADASKVNPSVPFFGGPTGLAKGGTTFGETVLSYGNSELRFGIAPLSPKQGISLGDTGGGWSHTVYTLTPGIPGDSGSGFFDAQGRALGVLSTVNLAPLPGANGVGDLAKELAYMHAHSRYRHVHLATGTQAFTGPLV